MAIKMAYRESILFEEKYNFSNTLAIAFKIRLTISVLKTWCRNELKLFNGYK